ncbi:MAG: hypothetical protein P8178_18470 [Candidatus Thiodiazotropha sp.]
MAMIVAYHADEGRLDITIAENFDLSQTREILKAQGFIDDQLQTCVIDCTRVKQVFDSGKALMLMLLEKLARFRVRLVMIGELAGVSCQHPLLATS